MFDKPLELIQSKSKEQWKTCCFESWTNMRIWVQENGELAFLLGLGIGFIFVVFFRLFALLLALAVIAGCLVFTFAPDEAVQAVEPEAEE